MKVLILVTKVLILFVVILFQRSGVRVEELEVVQLSLFGYDVIIFSRQNFVFFRVCFGYYHLLERHVLVNHTEIPENASVVSRKHYIVGVL